MEGGGPQPFSVEVDTCVHCWCTMLPSMDLSATSSPGGYRKWIGYKDPWHTDGNVCIVPKGLTWRRHIDQLHPHYRVNEDTNPGEDLQSTPLVTQVSSGSPASTDCLQDAVGTITTDGTPALG